MIVNKNVHVESSELWKVRSGRAKVHLMRTSSLTRCGVSAKRLQPTDKKITCKRCVASILVTVEEMMAENKKER